MTPPKTVMVTYTPWRYTGRKAWWRRLTFRPTQSPTYEFEAIPPGTYEYDDYIETGFSYRPVGPVRKVDR
jgi:hypothetical protein